MELADGMRSWDIHPKVVLMDYHTWQLNKDRYEGECNGFSTKLMTMTDHTGTHVDAQTHFFPDGNSIESYPPEKFMGEAIFLDLSQRDIEDPISAKDLEAALKETGERIKENDILTIKAWPYSRNHEMFSTGPGLTHDAAIWIIKNKFKMFATDLPTVDFQDMSRPVHVNLLKNDILIIENLINLDKIKQSRFNFIGMPLRLREATGSPIRAIAFVDQ
ncbi:cyclase family protein [Siminovitchia acidinfaciens]|uniref:Cyclase family protein n=1 Tax=Siminovitchia acidinfaciens TaxID=2321395 RepID=A0A429XZB5_9BACI|nr:cyclase family protein [Siminovitchia acidinfaciens]RST74128.1 cyclase family protein [Siminovitchia acidinfaciens]